MNSYYLLSKLLIDVFFCLFVLGFFHGYSKWTVVIVFCQVSCVSFYMTRLKQTTNG